MDNWIDWTGGTCPVDFHAKVCLRHRNGNEQNPGMYFASTYHWEHTGGQGDIVAYKVWEPTK